MNSLQNHPLSSTPPPIGTSGVPLALLQQQQQPQGLIQPNASMLLTSPPDTLSPGAMEFIANLANTTNPLTPKTMMLLQQHFPKISAPSTTTNNNNNNNNNIPSNNMINDPRQNNEFEVGLQFKQI